MAYRMVAAAALIGLSLLLPATKSRAAQPEETFEKYLDALVRDDQTGARGFWLPEYIVSCDRLGISFGDVPVKYDCASPIVANLAAIRDSLIVVAVSATRCWEHHARMTVSLIAEPDTLVVSYYALCTSAGWKLTSPLDVLTRDWKMRSTRYATIRYTDDRRVNDVGCDILDRSIERIGGDLGITAGDMARLEEQKIIYYLCDRDEIRRLTGFDTRGMTDFASDAVVSREFPHDHELTHVLVNFAIKDPPLFTAPFMQEGLACCLGGRWGRAPRTVLYTGYAVLSNDMAGLDDILTYYSFHTVLASPEVSYPVSALFVRYLIDEIGIGKVLRLYRFLSGSDEEIRSMTLDQTIATIQLVSGREWMEVDAGFESFWPRFSHGGIVPRSIDETDTPTASLAADGVSVALWQVRDTLLVKISIPGTASGGVLLFDTGRSDLTPEYESPLFAEHLPGESYRGERFGVKFSRDEVGLYDYACNSLLAGHIRGLDPDSPCWNADSMTLGFAIPGDLADLGEIAGRNLRLVILR